MIGIDTLGSPAFWDLLKGSPERLAQEICSIDLVDMDLTLQQHPALRGWVNAAFETSKIAEERAKWILNKTKAQAFITAKESNDPATGKPKNIASLEAEVELNSDVINAFEEYLTQARTRAVLRAMADALGDRKDMLIQIAAKQRHEASDHG